MSIKAVKKSVPAVNRIHIADRKVADGAIEWIHSEQRKHRSSRLGVMSGNAWSSPKRTWQKLRSVSAEPLLEIVRQIKGEAPRLSRRPWRLWGNILYAGGSIDWHDHRRALLAAVYYPNGSTAPLVFRGWQYRPEPGEVLMFSGAEPHCVRAYAGGEPRYSVAVNFYSRG